MKKWIGIGLMVVILMTEMQTKGAPLIRDEFNSAATGIPSSGIYTSAEDLGDASNATVSDGTIIGYDNTTSWSDSGYIESYANLVRVIATKYGWTYSGREITTSMVGKTEAYGKIVMRQNLDAASAASGQMHVGFGSSASLGSLGGALVGYMWDGSNWDMTLRYRDTGGSVVSAVIADNATNVTQEIYWKMDDVANTINVWVDNNDYSTAANLTVTDWGATVADISHMTFGEFETGFSTANFVYVYEVHLGDTGADVGMEVPPSSGFLFALRGPPDTDLYVAPSALGAGSGVDADNAAVYTNDVFWNLVQDTLGSVPVTVSLLDGNYNDVFRLDSIGDADHTLILMGESSDGVVFSEAGASVQVDIAGCQNMVLENLNFTGSGSGYALRIAESGGTVSRNIIVRNCDWYDMEEIVYGASGVHRGSHHVTFKNCSFERIGLNSGSHMMYHAYDADHVSVVNCYFEDCAGSYVRFRSGSDHGLVSGCTFVSTQTYANRSATSEKFVEFPVFNDVDPGDETFSLYATVTNNTFQFHSGSPDFRKSMNFYHRGYDPPGWNYLMTASEGTVLQGTDAFAKKNLLKNNCGIDFNEIVIEGNIWQNETGRIYFGSWAEYGAESQGWDGAVDISDIVFGQ